jgi:hypothetical protein
MHEEEKYTETASTEKGRELKREPYPSDDVLEDLYKINACATEEEFEALVASETSPRPIIVGQRFKLQDQWFKVKKIHKRDVTLRLCQLER